jgi:uncharacterized protein YeaO (DUF488 family)
LIDGLWPRGRTKKELRLSEWLKELAPTPSLRAGFGHDPKKYATFRARYRRELAKKPSRIARLTSEARKGTVTLVFGARDGKHSNASVLLELIEKRLQGRKGPRGPDVTQDDRRSGERAGPGARRGRD